MPQNFITGDVDQVFLMPPDMTDWLDEDDLAWTVFGAVREMDLSTLLGAYRGDGHGRAAYHPEILLAVLIYGYAQGVTSSRQMERLCVRDVGFRVLARNLRPDHATIARFRVRHQAAIEGLFSQVLRLCAKAGMVQLGQIALDGTKVAANAAWSYNRTEAGLGHLIEEEERFFTERSADLVAAHQATDAAEDALFGAERDAAPLPPELRRREPRLARLRQARQRLEQERQAREAAAAQQLQDWQTRKAATGRPGRRPSGKAQAPASGKPPRANTTDPQSRAMKCQHTLLQGYNAQLAVIGNQLIVGTMVTNVPVDQHLLHPMVNRTSEQLKRAGIEPVFTAIAADAGYASEDNFRRAATAGWQLLAPADPDNPKRAKPRRAVDPDKYPHTHAAQQILATPQGKQHYAERSRTVEPVFGQLKEAQSFRRFRRRGLDAVHAEWLLACTAHNLRKLHRNRTR